jgi:hypothetical protein
MQSVKAVRITPLARAESAQSVEAVMSLVLQVLAIQLDYVAAIRRSIIRRARTGAAST